MGLSVPDLVPLAERHIADAMRLKEAAGWNQTEADWHRLLRLSSRGGFAAELHGTLVGTATLLEYRMVGGDSLGWIGMVLVDPAYRRRGIGRMLLEHTARAACTLDVVGLDATPVGRALYRGYGFYGTATLDRWLCEEPGGSGSASPGGASADGVSAYGPSPGEGSHSGVDRATERRVISPVPEELKGRCAELDAEASGIDRAALLSSLSGDAPTLSAACMDGERVTGCAYGRRGSVATQIGPIAADGTASASALLESLLRQIRGAVVLDVPRGDPAWSAALRSRGFAPVRSFLRMMLGENGLGSLVAAPIEHAVAGPEYG